MKKALAGVVILSLLSACDEPGALPSDAEVDAGGGLDLGADAAVDATPDAAPADSEPLDTGPTDGGSTDAIADAGLADALPNDSGIGCGHPVGERYSAGDACNFCECRSDGSTVCTNRVCAESIGGCTYNGTAHGYGERFPSSSGCNECVCAASGLACTTRAGCALEADSAILLESADAHCGDDLDFTPAQVLTTLPVADFTAPFLYDRARPANLYPESLPDTEVRVRLVFEGGFMVCRLPSPDQPALDLQITVEWITADGALNEGFPAYLRRNNFGFLDAWLMAASQPLGGLHGSYSPNCALDPGGYSFETQVEPDGHATGSMHRVCETDLALTVGTFDRPAP